MLNRYNGTNIFLTVFCITFSTTFLTAGTLSLEEVDATTWNVNYTSDVDLGGFQFDVDGTAVSACSGGVAGANGFSVSGGTSGTVLGFSFTGGMIPAGEGILTIITVDSTPTGISGIVISDSTGGSIDDFTYVSGSISGCTDIDACNYYADATEDDGNCDYATGCDSCSGETDGTGTTVADGACTEGQECEDGACVDVPVECGSTCPGFENMDAAQDIPTDLCTILASWDGTGCYATCDSEETTEIDELITLCVECLANVNCDETFGSNEGDPCNAGTCNDTELTVDSFCNMDDGDSGFCEPCSNMSSEDDCYNDGLPCGGVEDCVTECFGGDYDPDSCTEGTTHFVVELDDTGQTHLTIFQDTITSLEIGDEIGVFDAMGVVESCIPSSFGGDCDPATDTELGEVLVGSGIWQGEQLNIVNIVSDDQSAVGGPRLNGAISGNAIIVKVFRAALDLELDATLTTTGPNFGGIGLSAITELVIEDPFACEDDDSGLTPFTCTDFLPDGTMGASIGCNGLWGDITVSDVCPVTCDACPAWGCMDDTACNYNVDAAQDDFSCVFGDGICDSCSGETDGTGTIVDNDADDDGVCDADEISGCTDDTACNYDSAATEDDGSCAVPTSCDSCADGAVVVDGALDGVCESCLDSSIVDNDQDDDGICDADEVPGCTDGTACNHDAAATDDDGTCWAANEGCTCDDPEGAVADCWGDCEGEAYIDNCDDCVGGNTGAVECAVDCNGVDGGTAEIDDCGNCAGGDTGMAENYAMDECDVCDGPGAVYECGCADIAEGACDCDGNPPADFYDCEGNCLNDIDGDLECDETDTTPNGDVSFSFSNAMDTSVDLNYDSNVDIYGFEFYVTGPTLTGISSDLEDSQISNDGEHVLGMSFSFTPLPAGQGLAATLYFDGSPEGYDLSVSGVIASGGGGDALGITGPDAVSIVPCMVDECGVCGTVGGTVECWDGSFVCEEMDCSEPPHFLVGLEETGLSQLTVFQDAITTLDPGDEIGIFDANGVVTSCIPSSFGGDCDPATDLQIGEVLVGAGTWDGMQMNVVSIVSSDNSSFGGPVTNGAVLGNQIMVKVFKTTETDSTEYATQLTLSAGLGNFGDLLQVVSEITLLGEGGEIFGCTDTDACNFNSAADSDDGTCEYPIDANHDCEGFCIVDFDCAGECGGSATTDDCGICGGGNGLMDECGVCFGSGAVEGYDCDGNCNTDDDSDGICNEFEIAGCSVDTACNYNAACADSDDSTCTDVDDTLCWSASEGCDCASGEGAEVDDCGVCNGDDSSCTNTDVTFSLGSAAGGMLEVYMSTSGPISGFQFNIPEMEIDSANGGLADQYYGEDGVTTGPNGVIGFSIDGNEIPSGEGLLTTIYGTFRDMQACLQEITVSFVNEGFLVVNGEGECVFTDAIAGCTDDTACNYNDQATFDDGSCELPETNYDCSGACSAGLDCAGECGGAAVDDVCGVCDGTETDSANCVSECVDGDTLGCDGVCAADGDELVDDDCGVCDGDGSSCWDCAGVSNGSNTEDNCGTCDDDSSNDCVQDCAGLWGGDLIVDECGVCGGDTDGDGTSDLVDACGECFGDNSTCTGCTDSVACNYDDTAIVDSDACEYAEEFYSCSDDDMDGMNDCINDTDSDGVCDELEVSGCTDDTACNYDNTATDDDGLCELCFGNDCDMFPAENWDCSGMCTAGFDCMGDCGGEAALDDCGTCGGDNSNCTGCTDSDACNYLGDSLFGGCDSAASPGGAGYCIDDGSCYSELDGFDCDGNCIATGDNLDENGLDCAGICGGATIVSTCGECSGSEPPEFYTCDNNSDGFWDCINDADSDGICDEVEILGCGDDTACNYDAACNDALNPTCTEADNTLCWFVTDEACTCDDGEGAAQQQYCLDADLDGLGNLDNALDSCFDPGNINDGDPLEYVNDCTDEDDNCNSNEHDSCGVCDGNGCFEQDCDTYPSEIIDCDGACIMDTDGDLICDEYEIAGCTDVFSINYNSDATDDDGSCVYQPQNLEAVGGDGIITLTWEAWSNDENREGNTLSLSDNGDGSWNVNYVSDAVIGGLQFNVDGTGVTACSGGAAAAAGFQVSGGASGTVIGFSFTGSTIPAGEGILTIITVDDTPTGLSGIVMSDAAGSQLDFTFDEGEGGDDDNTFDLSYNVYRDDTLLAEAVNETSYVDSGLADGVTHTYIVKQTNGVDESAPSESATATTFVNGCMSSTACNYNSNATNDDGSCLEPTGCETCDGETDGTGQIVVNDDDGDGVCNDDEVEGCMDSEACNYYADATDNNDVECVLPIGCETCSGQTDGNGVIVYNDDDDDGVCNDDEVSGCTDEMACNFNSAATDEDGSCVSVDGVCETCSGETDGTGTVVDNDSDDDSFCNDVDACEGHDDMVDVDFDGVPDGCEVPGCTDVNADNYDAAATDEDDSCTYTPEAPELLTPDDGTVFDLDDATDQSTEGIDLSWLHSGYYGNDELFYLLGVVKMNKADIQTNAFANNIDAISAAAVVWSIQTDSTIAVPFEQFEPTSGSNNEYTWYVEATTDTTGLSSGDISLPELDLTTAVTVLSAMREFSIDATSLANSEWGVPTEFTVHQNFPNPFNPSTTIEFDVAQPENVTLLIFDLTGKEINRLADGFHVPGRYSVVWDAMDDRGEPVSSGMYIYQYRTPNMVMNKKLVLLR